MKVVFCVFLTFTLGYSICFAQEKLNEQYGICAHLSRNTDFRYRDAEISIMQKIGIKWARMDFDWANVQREKDSFYTNMFDSVHVSSNNKIKILPILGYYTSFYKPAWKYIPEWNAYVAAMVKRYGSEDQYWEVWNEENLPSSWDFNKDRVIQYTNLIMNTYQTIKRYNGNLKVLLGGLGGCDLDYIDSLIKNGATNYFDIINIHEYFDMNKPEIIYDKIIRLYNLLEDKGIKKPLWITETGFPTQKDKLSHIYSFYSDFLPYALDKLAINPSESNIGIVIDTNKNYYAITESEYKDNPYEKYFKNVRYITLNEIIRLSPKDVPVLVPSMGESFPCKYVTGLVSYLKKGGTIIFSQGVPLYYDLQEKNGKLISKNNIVDDYRKQLHIGMLFWWSQNAKKLNVPKIIESQRMEKGLKYNWNLKGTNDARFLTNENLVGNDQFIPLLYAGNNCFEGCVAGIYKLNSNLNGNIIIQTRRDRPLSISREKIQAQNIPRYFISAFAAGAEKIFMYNLRANENDVYYSESNYGIVHKDLSPKPAYYSYKTLISMLPSGSTRPLLNIKNDVYIATWRQPNGDYVMAVWKSSYFMSAKIKSEDQIFRYTYMGEKNVLKSKIVNINGNVQYFLSKKKIEVTCN